MRHTLVVALLLVSSTADAGFPNGSSGNALGGWSGYLQNNAGPYTQVQATWRIPGITLDPAVPGVQDLMFQWVGIDSQSKLIQTGIEEIVSSGGVVTLSAWYECFPAALVPFGNTPQIGDVITASVNCTANCTSINPSQTWTAVVHDVTQGWTATQTGIVCATGLQDVLPFIAETNAVASSNGSIVHFGDIPVTGITVNNANPGLTTAQELYGFAHGGGASTATANPSDPNATMDGLKICWGQGDSGQSGTSGYTPCPNAPSLLFDHGRGIGF